MTEFLKKITLDNLFSDHGMLLLLLYVIKPKNNQLYSFLELGLTDLVT